jgi:hypothetical protein
MNGHEITRTGDDMAKDNAPPTEAITASGDIVPIDSPDADGSPIVLHDDLPVDEKYDIALKITCPVLAAEYFEACVAHTMKTRNKGRKEAKAMERTTLAFVASSKGKDVLDRIKKLYGPPPEPKTDGEKNA